MKTLLRRLKAFWNRRQMERELEEEMRFHLEQSGRAAFGNSTRILESSREAWVWPWLETIGQDIRYALRSFRANRGFTAVALLSLAFGIGANTAIFSLVDAILLKSLPVDQPQQLHAMSVQYWRGQMRSCSYPFYRAIHEQLGATAPVLAWGGGQQFDTRISGQAEVVRAQTQLVSANFFDVLRVRPIVGRPLLKGEDDQVNPAPVAVISYGFWQRALHGDPEVLQRTLDIERTSLRIVGVAPPEFEGLMPVASSPDVYLPLTLQPVFSRWGSMLDRPGSGWLTLVFRVPQETPVGSFESRLKAVWRQIQHDKDPKQEEKYYDRVILVPAHNGLDAGRSQFSKPLWVLMAAVGLVLLIACANIANLQLARGAARYREIGVRLAIGASRARVIRQLLTEGMVLATGGALLGLLLAQWGHALLLRMIEGEAGIPPAMTFQLDWRTLAFTSAVSVVTVVLFAWIPAIRSTKMDANPALKKDSRSIAGGGMHSWLGRGLLATQVGLSLILLVGAALFLQTLRNLMRIDTGFAATNVVQAQIDGFGDAAQRTALYSSALDRLRAIPGVSSVSISQNGLFSGGTSRTSLSVQGYAPRKDEDYLPIYLEVGSDYFRTMGTPLLLGRDFTERDRSKAPKVIIVNEAMARYFWRNENPIGKRVSFDDKPKAYDVEVIGVAKDVKYDDLRQPARTIMYRPMANPYDWRGMVTLIVKTSSAPEPLMAAIRKEIRAVDPQLRVERMRTLPAMISDTLLQQRLVTQLVAVFGVAALILAAIGLYGMLAYGVVRRTSEIGIRMALGAIRRNVVWLVIRESLFVVAIGLSFGMVGAVAMGSVLESMLFEMKPTDPWALLSAAILLLSVAAVAAWLPARRAATIDPIEALRYE